MNKLALGTVQFGLPYGINNPIGVPSDKDLSQLLDTAFSNGIRYLDTATAYGNAEERLGKLATHDFNIVSKFPVVATIAELQAQFSVSCQHLNRTSLYGYLAHNAAILLKSPVLWNYLQELQSTENIQKIGVSLYHPEELLRLLDMGIIPQLVQVPYSLLDRKFEPYFEQLKALKVEIHTRSSFLQGLYFKSPNELPAVLQPLKPALMQLHRLVRESAFDMETVALNFVINNPLIDQVVIGVETVSQLENNLRATMASVPDSLFDELKAIVVEAPHLLNPAIWHA
ncbi:MAG: aldo/keto reductase [Fluviicola sp.]|nr:aldo/keto reductase [Fluviicola sp.]